MEIKHYSDQQKKNTAENIQTSCNFCNLSDMN